MSARPLIADALTSVGAVDVAYRLLFQRRSPSWLYPVTMGSTTVWERWDSMLPDGSINPSGMTSFNHYALGAVADWLHRTVAGLAPAGPGYRELLVHPRPGRELTTATARHETPYGEAAVSWHRTDGRFRLAVRVPVGSRAAVYVPGEPEPVRVGHGDHAWDVEVPSDHMTGIGKGAVIRDLVDDADLWDALVAICVESGLAADDVDVAHKVGRWLDEPIGRLAAALTFNGFIPGGEALMERLQPLLSHAERPEVERGRHVDGRRRVMIGTRPGLIGQMRLARLALTTVLLMVAISIAPATSAQPEPVTLTFYEYNEDAMVAAAEGLAADFTALNPHVTIDVETRPGGTEGDNLVKTRLATGDMTDLFQYTSGIAAPGTQPGEDARAAHE